MEDVRSGSRIFRWRVSALLPVLCGISSLAFVVRASWAIPIDFEGLRNLEAVTNQFALTRGVSFDNAVTLEAHVSLNEFSFPPHSGGTVAAILDNTQSMILTFQTAHTAVSGWVTYTDPLTFTVFDPGGNLLTTLTSAATSNLGSNEYFAISGIGPIGSMQISQNGSNPNRAFTLDDINAAPEPASVLLLGSGLGSLLLRRSRRLRLLVGRAKSSI